MCNSFRSAAYFGSSVHVAFSIIFLVWFLFDTLIRETKINLWKCDPLEQTFSDVNPVVHYFNVVFKVFYFNGLCITGIYIFKGVEKESFQILKFAIIAFVILQVVGIYLFSVFFSIQWRTEPEDSSVAVVTSNKTGGDDYFPGEFSSTENGDDGRSLEIVLNVTTVESDDVFETQDFNDTGSEPATHIPYHPLVTDADVEDSDSMTTPVPAITVETIIAVLPLPPPLKKLPHNQLVRLVFQMCFELANGLMTLVYMLVLGLYMVKL